MQEGAQWFALLRSGEASEAERRQWQAWRGADPAHEQAWQYVEAVSQGFAPAQAGVSREQAGQTLLQADRQLRGRRRWTLGITAVAACADFDYVISLTAPNSPAPAEWPSPTNDPLRPLEHIGFTVPFNMSEQPAASINCGYSSEGLPIGLQIAGQRFDDLGVLRVARAFEQIRGAQRPWPEPPGD